MPKGGWQEFSNTDSLQRPSGPEKQPTAKAQQIVRVQPTRGGKGGKTVTVIRGLEIGVVGMREGGVRRVVIPPAVSYQDKTQEPVPRDFSNRQRLYTTIFNPTRIANGEGDTLSTVVFDIELVRVVKQG